MEFEEIIIGKEFVCLLWGLHLGVSYCALILIQSWQSENNWAKEKTLSFCTDVNQHNCVFSTGKWFKLPLSSPIVFRKLSCDCSSATQNKPLPG